MLGTLERCAASGAYWVQFLHFLSFNNLEWGGKVEQSLIDASER
jgi:hypothetical protein